MTYAEGVRFLFSRLPMYQRIGPRAYKPGLDTIKKLLEIIGNPHRNQKFIHVAGTNGKGSTSHALASILMEARYKTGLFTSPHLLDFRERIRVNGKPIPRHAVIYFIEKHKQLVQDLSPSFFEWTTAMAFWWFREKQCDISVVEVGMGGRLDSTNVLDPLISVITSISYDHMEFLGNTLEKIASEKAGIIKPGKPVVISTTQKEIKKVFLNKAMACNSRVCFAESKYRVLKIVPQRKTNLVHVKAGICKKKYAFGLGGQYQRRNIPGVLMACELLKTMDYDIKEKHIRQGLKKITENTGLMGRWQIWCRSPLTILDVGHNQDGIQEVVRQTRLLKRKKIFYIFGVVKDKDMEKIFQHLPRGWFYLLVTPGVERGRDASDLEQEFRKKNYQQTALCKEGIKEAWRLAKKSAGRKDLILVGGSTFVVADFLKKIRQ